MTNSGIDRLTGIVVLLLPVVGVAMSWRPPSVHYSNEAMSFVLMLDIASCNVGSVIPVGIACSFGWMDIDVTGVGVGCWAGSSDCCCPVGWSSVHISFNSFSILVL